MTIYKVVSAKQTGTKTTDYGEMQNIALTLVNGDGVTEAGWFTKAATPLPKEGDELQGTVEPGPYGNKFKKDRPQAGGFGPRPRDPKETAAIVRQHSQHMALLYLQAKAQQGAIVQFPSMEELRKVIDWFDADVARAKVAT